MKAAHVPTGLTVELDPTRHFFPKEGEVLSKKAQSSLVEAGGLITNWALVALSNTANVTVSSVFDTINDYYQMGGFKQSFAQAKCMQTKEGVLVWSNGDNVPDEYGYQEPNDPDMHPVMRLTNESTEMRWTMYLHAYFVVSDLNDQQEPILCRMD